MGFVARRVSLLVLAMAITGTAVASAQGNPEPAPEPPTPASATPASPVPASSEAEPKMPLPESAPPRIVASTCDAHEAEELRAHLITERRRATTWNRVWRWTFTAVAVGSLGVGLANPVPALQDGLYVGAGKAAVGAAARWVVPLKVDVPDPNADTCADVAALRKAVRANAKKEKSIFILGHIGGLAVNLGGAALLWYRDSFKDAALSIAVGYPFGLLSTYWMPRGSWHLDRDRAWTIAVTPSPDGTGWFAQAGGAF